MYSLLSDNSRALGKAKKRKLLIWFLANLSEGRLTPHWQIRTGTKVGTGPNIYHTRQYEQYKTWLKTKRRTQTQHWLTQQKYECSSLEEQIKNLLDPVNHQYVNTDVCQYLWYFFYKHTALVFIFSSLQVCKTEPIVETIIQCRHCCMPTPLLISHPRQL